MSKGRAARNKGSTYEREVAATLQTRFGHPVKRKLGAAREGGDDIVFGPLSIECKRRETLSIPEWVRQARSNATPKNPIPIVVYRRSNEKSHVVLSLDDFLDLAGGAILLHLLEKP